MCADSKIKLGYTHSIHSKYAVCLNYNKMCVQDKQYSCLSEELMGDKQRTCTVVYFDAVNQGLPYRGRKKTELLMFDQQEMRVVRIVQVMIDAKLTVCGDKFKRCPVFIS